MISTVELCVRNFVDHGIERQKAVGFTTLAIFLFGLPSAGLWILVDSDSGVAFPQFLEVQDHIWGYGLMFSGLFIAYSIWKYGWTQYRAWQDENDITGFNFREYLDNGVSPFRDDFINTGDNDWWIGRWWDYIMYLGFPLMFGVLMLSYFSDLILNAEHNPWNPTNPDGIMIILLFWGVTAGLFISMNKYILINRVTSRNGSFWPGNWELEPRPLYRNVPKDAEVSIKELPGGADPFIVEAGETLPETFVNEYGETKTHTLHTQ
jgi:NSS family neurotransmitter:Na+ symporter